MRREGRITTPLGYLGAFATNAISRKAMGGWLERVIFSDTREPMPLHLHDYRTHTVALDAANLQPSILASCSIPFWLQAVHVDHHRLLAVFPGDRVPEDVGDVPGGVERRPLRVVATKRHAMR